MLEKIVAFNQNLRIMTKYQENFISATSFIKKLSKIKMVTLLLGHPVFQCKPNDLIVCFIRDRVLQNVGAL